MALSRVTGNIGCGINWKHAQRCKEGVFFFLLYKGFGKTFLIVTYKSRNKVVAILIWQTKSPYHKRIYFNYDVNGKRN